jgi:hypothetical protein
VSMSHWTAAGSLSGTRLTRVSLAGGPHVALVGAQVPSCGPMVLLCAVPAWLCGPVALLLSGAVCPSGAAVLSGAVGVSGAAGVPYVVPLDGRLGWVVGFVGVGLGIAGSGLVLVSGAPVVWLAGVVCGVELCCAVVPGVLLVCWVSGFSPCRGGGGACCHGYAQCCGDDGVEDAHGCPAFS